MGVIAPSHFKPVIANRYKLPENKIIPIVKNHIDKSKFKLSILLDNKTNTKIPIEWKNWYKTPVWKTDNE